MTGPGDAAGRHLAGWPLAPATHDREGGEIDIVIPVKVGDRNEHLRYALRSFAAHLPHDRVWVIGHRPTWLANVHYLPTRQAGTKYANTTAAMRAACQHNGVSDPFIWVNDDMFVMRLLRVLPAYHRGRVADVDAHYRRKRIRSAYLTGMRETWQLLTRLGHPDPWSYEVHAPMLIGKAGMIDALDRAAAAGLQAVHKRTLYGTLAGIGGQRIRDPKVLTRGPGFDRDALFLSTMPLTFSHGRVGEYIRGRLPDPCRYEQPGSQPAVQPPPAGRVRRARRPARGAVRSRR